MADIVYNMDGQSTGVVRAWQGINTAIEDMLRTVGDITPASEKAAAAQKALGSTAERWLKQMRTPLDDHLKRMAELQALVQAGNLTQHEYTKGIALSVAEMKKAEEAADTYGQAAKAVLDELATPQDRHNARLAHLSELRSRNKISEAEYAAAVDKAKAALDGQNVELQQMLSLAAQIKQSAVAPQQEYNEKLAKLKQLLDAGHLSQSEYAKAVAKTKQEYVATTQAGHEMTSSGKRGLEGMSVSGRELIGTVTAMAAGFGLVQKSITAVIAENHRLGQSITDTFRKLDQEELKMQIQAGLTPQQAQAQMPKIKEALLNTPSTTLAGAVQLQTQLASSGFQQADIDSNAALQTVLDLKAATNQFGESMGDEKEAVLSLSMYLKGMGVQAPSAANIKELGKQLVTLFATSEIQFPDLKHLAPNAGTLKSFGLSDKEQLAGFSTLVDVMGGEKAATGLRNVVTRMATAAKSDERKAAFKELGFKPEDVDIAIGGDQFIPTLEKVSKALKSKTPEQANRLLSEIFGDEGQSAAAELFNPEKIALIKKRIAEQGNGAAFDLSVTTFQQSGYAERQRRQVKTDYALRQAGMNQQGAGHQDVKEIGQQAAAVAAGNGGNLSAPVAVGQSMFGIGEGLGMTPEQTAQWIQFMALRQDRSWGGFLTGQRAKPALKIGQKPAPGNRGLPLPRPAAAVPDMPLAAGAGAQAEFKPSPQLQALAAGVQAATIHQSVNAQPVNFTPAQIGILTDALNANTAATMQNTAKPVVVKTSKPINKPTKDPKSAALAAPGGR
jgi:hypothetical protein